MKKILPLLFFAALFASFGVMQAQSEYHPFTDGCSWSVSNEKYMTAGDTVLDGKTYLRVYRQEGNQPFEFNMEEAEYFAAIRNDLTQKKVYAYLPAGTSIRNLSDYSVTQTDTAMDVLIYDFSLEIGDTLTYYMVGRTVAAKAVAVRSESANVYVGWIEYSSVNHQYSAGDTVVYLSDNSSHHQILLHGISFSTPDNVWIDGIGGIRGFNEAAQDVLYIELSGMVIANVALYDLQGRAVETLRATSLQGTTATFSLKTVPAGVYLLRVTDTNGREHHQKIVKK